MKAKDKLISVAIELFSERGHDGTSITEVAESAGVNVALISYHFGGKEGLLSAALEKLAHGKLQRAERVLGKCASANEFRVRLELFLGEMAVFFAEESQILNLLFRELEKEFEGAEKEFGVAYSGLLKSFTRFLKEAHDKGFIREISDIRTVPLQLLSPLTALVRSKKSAAKYLNVSLDDPKFRAALVQDLVAATLR